jgi:hypothetical protein
MMKDEKTETMSHDITPFEAIRRTNPAGNEFWSSRGQNPPREISV